MSSPKVLLVKRPWTELAVRAIGNTGAIGRQNQSTISAARMRSASAEQVRPVADRCDGLRLRDPGAEKCLQDLGGRRARIFGSASTGAGASSNHRSSDLMERGDYSGRRSCFAPRCLFQRTRRWQIFCNRARSWSAPERLETPGKAPPPHCLPTATPPSSAALATTAAPGRRGSTRAAAGSGPSKAPSWSAPERLEPPCKAISVALSADGNTAIVGGFGDNGRSVRRGSTRAAAGSGPSKAPSWSAPERWETPSKASSVALSADGNTAIVGGAGDNNNAGAAWVFTRSGGVWTQQGPKLVGTGAVGGAQQGFSVALSADGNTAIVGGLTDNGNAGAAWVYTRSGGVWTQQGPKLVGTGAVGNAAQGESVALSADGNTAIVGGHFDNSSAGAAWVYTRSGGVWTQQGNKLVGTGAVGTALQGFSVSLSADGNTAIVGGFTDNSNAGAAWVYTRSGGLWTQQGSKLVGTGAVGAALQGYSVSLSADGNTAIVGGQQDNSQAGAAWVFVQPATATHDFDVDGRSDIAWRHDSGQTALWLDQRRSGRRDGQFRRGGPQLVDRRTARLQRRRQARLALASTTAALTRSGS